jgi:hypothetical protein
MTNVCITCIQTWEGWGAIDKCKICNGGYFAETYEVSWYDGDTVDPNKSPNYCSEMCFTCLKLLVKREKVYDEKSQKVYLKRGLIDKMPNDPKTVNTQDIPVDNSKDDSTNKSTGTSTDASTDKSTDKSKDKSDKKRKLNDSEDDTNDDSKDNSNKKQKNEIEILAGSTVHKADHDKVKNSECKCVICTFNYTSFTYE